MRLRPNRRSRLYIICSARPAVAAAAGSPSAPAPHWECARCLAQACAGSAFRPHVTKSPDVAPAAGGATGAAFRPALDQQAPTCAVCRQSTLDVPRPVLQCHRKVKALGALHKLRQSLPRTPMPMYACRPSSLSTRTTKQRDESSVASTDFPVTSYGHDAKSSPASSVHCTYLSCHLRGGSHKSLRAPPHAVDHSIAAGSYRPIHQLDTRRPSCGAGLCRRDTP